MSDATTTLLTSWGEREEENIGNGMIAIKMDAGRPHTWAIYNAVVSHYHDLTEQPQPTSEDLEALLGEKVTIVRVGENMLGGGMVVATEGTLFAGSRGPAILPKRARRNGQGIDPAKLLDIFPGYATAEAQGRIDKIRSHFPTLQALTQERLERLPEPSGDGDSPALTLCLFGTYHMPDDFQTDAIVLAGEYDRENDIVDGGVALLRPEVGVSEHGSFYGRDLLRTHRLGEVVGYQPLTFREGVELCDLDFDEAYARVITQLEVSA
jgi:hypothetical protein